MDVGDLLPCAANSGDCGTLWMGLVESNRRDSAVATMKPNTVPILALITMAVIWIGLGLVIYCRFTGGL